MTISPEPENNVPEPPETEWATEEEKREEFQRSIDRSWEEWAEAKFNSPRSFTEPS